MACFVLTLKFFRSLLTLISDITKAKGWNSPEVKFQGNVIPILWKLPFYDQDIILNVGGGSKGNPSLAATGALLRQSDGTFVDAISRCIGYNKSNTLS